MFFSEDAAVPSKWQETLKYRECKLHLTSFLSTYILNHIETFLDATQRFITSCESGCKVSSPCEHGLPTYSAGESDTCVWLHTKYSVWQIKKNNYILSLDTDIYHIGMPLISPSDHVIIQLSKW